MLYKVMRIFIYLNFHEKKGIDILFDIVENVILKLIYISIKRYLIEIIFLSCRLKFTLFLRSNGIFHWWIGNAFDSMSVQFTHDCLSNMQLHSDQWSNDNIFYSIDDGLWRSIDLCILICYTDEWEAEL